MGPIEVDRDGAEGDVGAKQQRAAVSALADEYWTFHRSTAQSWNIDRGDVDQIEHWEDLSSDGTNARTEILREFSRRAAELIESVDGPDHTLAAAVGFGARSMEASLPYMRDMSFVAGPMNIVSLISVMVPAYGLTTVQHGQGYVTKLRSTRSFIEGWIDGLLDGAAAGRTATARGIAATIDEIDLLLAAREQTDPLNSQAPPAEMTAREVSVWRNDVLDAVRHHVRPALALLRATLYDEILPLARSDDRAGIGHLPGGASDYQALLYASTSTQLTAEQVHQRGRDQLERLDDEYAALGTATFQIHDPVAVRNRLRDDTNLQYDSADEIIADAERILQRATDEARWWFARMPTAQCRAVPARGGGMAYYTAPSPDGARGGTCYFNVADPTMWTRSSLEATTFHESIPGHHLQLALSLELDLHPILGELEVASFGEGWGLYAERLADEMGMYSGPIQRLGMLTLDSLRAARLVVDTGLHAMGWTRNEAIEFLGGVTSLTPRIVEREIDRYIADPGQATSYMIGRLEIQRLRHDAEERLRDRFDLAGFHTTVLDNGMTPLPALERTVDQWIVATSTTTSPSRSSGPGVKSR